MNAKPSGDSGIFISLGNEINESVNRKVIGFVNSLEKWNSDYIEELIPSYTGVLVMYRPLLISYIDIIEKIKLEYNNFIEAVNLVIEVVHIPVLYGAKYGEDLKFVADFNNLTEEKVIEIHSEKNYLIYMLGFTPGFPYLGGISKSINAPRLEEPRKKIKAGSIGIAGNQTGIYPIDSPGGWRIIGRTPLELFNIKNKSLALLKAGQYIKFDRVTEKEYLDILSKIKNGTYIVNIEKKEI